MDNINNKRQEIAVVIALIATASLLSVGAVAATTPAYAGGDNDDGDVKQKAESEAECDQKNKVEDGSLNVQTNEQALCIAASININDLGLID
jgi:hypothetical protein